MKLRSLSRPLPRLGLAAIGPILALALVGCDSPGLTTKAKSAADAAKAKAKPAVGETSTTSAALPPLGDGAQTPAVFSAGLSVSDAIAKACGIKPREARKTSAPSFEFDSAALQESDREMLAEVAKCLTEGALKGRSVTLIGRADLRGEPEYNMTLGGSRADAVQRYLVDLGIGKGRTSATSRGALDATGSDEAGYAEDRRVDIELVQ